MRAATATHREINAAILGRSNVGGYLAKALDAAIYNASATALLVANGIRLDMTANGLPVYDFHRVGSARGFKGYFHIDINNGLEIFITSKDKSKLSRKIKNGSYLVTLPDTKAGVFIRMSNQADGRIHSIADKLVVPTTREIRQNFLKSVAGVQGYVIS